jgi:hypothetical protein
MVALVAALLLANVLAEKEECTTFFGMERVALRVLLLGGSGATGRVCGEQRFLIASAL